MELVELLPLLARLPPRVLPVPLPAPRQHRRRRVHGAAHVELLVPHLDRVPPRRLVRERGDEPRPTPPWHGRRGGRGAQRRGARGLAARPRRRDHLRHPRRRALPLAADLRRCRGLARRGHVPEHRPEIAALWGEARGGRRRGRTRQRHPPAREVAGLLTATREGASANAPARRGGARGEAAAQKRGFPARTYERDAPTSFSPDDAS
mmetsp:Transcript_118115/g.328397  ORF Transcript_118115/g.328397 Transcript_118115/m.328397 type:complete len:207 (-) Transcript_118115:32-652(-)